MGMPLAPVFDLPARGPLWKCSGLRTCFVTIRRLWPQGAAAVQRIGLSVVASFFPPRRATRSFKRESLVESLRLTWLGESLVTAK
ncbi:MAG: hypothetical protein EB015_17540 [Methylocystaceae bacterium]|nr:hypothetical protein [Methylocystaceae bacterium]